MSRIELSPVLLRELRKAVAAGKKKALAVPKAIATSALALECLSGVGSDAMSSRNSLQLPVSKGKADELSSSDGLSKPASHCPAQGDLFGEGPTAQSSMGELAAESSRQLGLTEGGLAYATVVAGRTGPQQTSVPHKPPAKGSDHYELTASSEAATRHIFQRHVRASPLCVMPVGTTSSAQVATKCFAPAVKRQNKTPIYVSGVTDTRGYLMWIQASCHGRLSDQIKGERQMLIPQTADGFRTTISRLRSLMGARVGVNTPFLFQRITVQIC